VITLEEAIEPGEPLRPRVDAKGGLLEAFKEGYEQDKLFVKIVTQLDHYLKFQLRDGLLYSNNTQGVEVLMVP
jgi:hypothetical protein